VARSLKIAGVERWPDLDANSLEIEAVLTYQLDTSRFRVRGDQPTEGEEVIIEDGSIRLFGGIIVKVELVDKDLQIWAVECDDYTNLLDRKLVVESYTGLSASNIFLDIAAKYCPGFTTTGVRTGAPTIETTGDEFNYKPVSECFKWLCEYVSWHWQPTYNKDLEFFSAEELAAPAPMTLESGGYFRNHKHAIDQQGLRNRIYVRGGTMLSDPQLVEWKADGVARHWPLPFKSHDVSLMVGGVAKTVGVENFHDEADYDYMMSFQEKYLRCSSGTATPADGTTMSLTAKQDIDVITVVEDLASQQAIAAVQGGDGVYEHVIVDDSLTTIDAAEAAGNADLREHANPRVKGSFETEVNGWAPGQLVTINLPDRGITGQYLIQKVTITPATDALWTYRVEYGGRLLGIADFLKALVSAQQKKKLGETSVLHKFTYGSETVQVSDESRIIRHRMPFYVKSGPLFTRASVAYKQDGTQVVANQPRFETGKFDQAVMVEEGTTNLLTANQSSVETDTTGLNATADATISRDTVEKWHGVASLKVVTAGIGTAEGFYTESINVTPSATYTASVWLKGSGTVNLRIREIDSAGATIGDTFSNVITLTSQWTRYSVTRTFGSTGVKANMHVRTVVTQAITFYADGLQIEQKAFATSWTLGGSTRSPETLTIPTAGVLNPQEGTVEGWVYVNSTLLARNWNSIWGSLTGFADNGLWLDYYKDGNQWRFRRRINNSENGPTWINNLSEGWHYFACVWKPAEMVLFIDGVRKATLTNPGLPSVVAAYCDIGGLYRETGGFGSHCNSLIDDLRISSRARTDEEILAGYQSGEPLEADADTTYKLDFDGIIQDIVTTPVCGFVMCASA
jgi:hypothetical protein